MYKPWKQNLPKPTRYRDQFGDLWIDGEMDMGRYRTPPMPNYLILTDRVTGQEMALLNNDELTAVVPTVPLTIWTSRAYFGPQEGPYSGDWRLYLSNGALAFEYAPGYSSPMILTRNAFQPTVLQITADTNGNVVLTPYAL
jgi:hypothetical protein